MIKNLLISCVFFLGISSYADQYTPLIFPEMGAEGKSKIIELIQHSEKELNLGIYRLEDSELIQAILDASDRGVQVNILINDFDMSGSPFDLTQFSTTIQKLGENRNAYERLNFHPNISIKTFPTDLCFLYHSKFLVIDGRKSLISTFNFNSNGLCGARNLGVIIEDPALGKSLNQVFYSDFNNLPVPESIPDNLAIAPINYLEQIQNFIQTSHKTLDIYQTGLSKRDICTLLDSVALDHDLDIRILTSLNVFSSGSKTEDMEECLDILTRNLHIQVREITDSSFYIHAKLLLSDSTSEEQGKIFIGSSNFLNEGLLHSRELGFIFSDPAVMNIFSDIFQLDWDKGNPIDRSLSGKL